MFFKLVFTDDGSYTQTGFRIIENKYAIAGFFATHSDKHNITLLLDGGLPIGRYTVVDLLTRKVYVDKYRLHNTMIYKDHIITNTIYLLEYTEFEVNKESEKQFNNLEYLEYPNTMFKHLTFVTGNNGVDHATLWETADNAANVSDFVKVIEKATKRIITKYNPKTFRISGGLDTRIIAESITKLGLGFPDLETLCHPDLEVTEDADIIIARKLAALLKQNIKIIEPLPKDYHYLGGKEGDILSGMYGGELLGGTAHTLVFLAETPRRKKLGDKIYLLELLLSSFKTRIYGNEEFGWAAASVLNSFQYSPFVEQEFLDLFLLTNYDELKDYSVYNKIYQKVKTIDLPLVSPISAFFPELYESTSHIDPKTLNKYSYETTFKLKLLE